MKDLKISKKSITFFFLIFFSLKISCISYVSDVLNSIWYFGAIIVIIYSISNLMINKKLNLFDLFSIMFYIILLFSTIINHGALYDCVKELISFLSLYMVMRIGLESNAKKYIKMMNSFLLVYTIINTLITIFYYPKAMFMDNKNPIFFLGGDNTSVRLYVAAVLFNTLNTYIKQRKLKIPAIPLINLLIFSIIRDLGGGKVCFIILLIATLYLVYGIKIPKKIIKTIMLFNIILFFVIVIFNKINIFSYFIVNVLNRNLTLTDRTTIWQITIDKIIKKPILGYGMIDGLDFQAMLPYLIGINAHNTYLMILFNGGMVLFTIFIILFLITSKKFDKIKHERWIYIIPFTLFTLMIRAQIEGWDVIWIFLFLLLAYSFEKIEPIVEEK